MSLGSYDHKRIESKWQSRWKNRRAGEVDLRDSRDAYYMLVMFPYPSGDRLHVGHGRNYIMGDALYRYLRMRGRGALMTATKILIVEDEAPIREGLRDHLRREGYSVVTAETVGEAEQQLNEQPDLLILDRRLPDGDGLEVLQKLRMQGMDTSVIVLSAMGETMDRIEGLEDGADDYLTKPFHLRELVARVRAVLGRTQEGEGREGKQITFGDHQLDVGARTLKLGKKDVPLTRLEFDLLLYFLRNADRAISRNELLDRVWGYDKFPTTRTVDYHVLSLRKKIERDDSNPNHIVTVHRVGYRFEP